MNDTSSKLAEMARSYVASGTEWNAQGIVEIVAPDLEAMLSFYAKLGFRVERRTGPFAVLNGFGIRIFVAENPAVPRMKRWANIRIVVDDADLVWECVSAMGLPIANAIADRPYGLRDFVLEDPGGFEIRFAQVIRGQ